MDTALTLLTAATLLLYWLVVLRAIGWGGGSGSASGRARVPLKPFFGLPMPSCGAALRVVAAAGSPSQRAYRGIGIALVV